MAFVFNYSVKEVEHKYELICKTFGRKSLMFFAAFVLLFFNLLCSEVLFLEVWLSYLKHKFTQPLLHAVIAAVLLQI